MRRYVVIGYLVFLSMMVGVTLTLGALVAPVIFHADDLMTLAISHYEEGLIMQEIFRRSVYIYLALALAVLIYEVYDYRNGHRDSIVITSAFVVLFTVFMFAFYYTPDMIALQQAQQTQTAAFESLHKGSELDFKIMLVALLTLLLRRFTQLVRKK
jgi:hypothetical protein